MSTNEHITEELRKVGELERSYHRCAEMMEPCATEENPARSAAVHLRALQGIERCIRLRAKLRRGTAEPEPESGALSTIDLARLSDSALREVHEALVPAMSNLKTGKE